jgi:hypothetical protein
MDDGNGLLEDGFLPITTRGRAPSIASKPKPKGAFRWGGDGLAFTRWGFARRYLQTVIRAMRALERGRGRGRGRVVDEDEDVERTKVIAEGDKGACVTTATLQGSKYNTIQLD